MKHGLNGVLVITACALASSSWAQAQGQGQGTGPADAPLQDQVVPVLVDGAAAPVAMPGGLPGPEISPAERAARAQFSLGRFFAESLGSGLAGGLAGYGTGVALCGGTPCLGGFLVGSLVNLSIVAGGTMLIGGLMGGEGNWLYTALGALLPFSVAATGDPVAAFAIEMALAPFSAAAIYELTSNMQSAQLAPPRGSNLQLQVFPVSSAGGGQGWVAQLGGAF